MREEDSSPRRARSWQDPRDGVTMCRDDVAEGRSSCLGVVIRHCLCNQVSSQQNRKHSCDAQLGALPVLFCDQSSTGPSCPHPRRSVHSVVARCPHRLTWQHHPGRYSNQKLGSSRVGSTCSMLIIESQSNKCLLTALCHLWGKRDCNEVPSKYVLYHLLGCEERGAAGGESFQGYQSSSFFSLFLPRSR